jgi:hypothetical protein
VLSREAELWAAGSSAPGQAQARRRDRYLDNLYEEYGLCVEVDGEAAHPAEGRWRDNANLAQGARTLRYGWPDVTAYRCRTAAEITAVLRSQGWTGALRRCGPDCTAIRSEKADSVPRRGETERAQTGRAGTG